MLDAILKPRSIAVAGAVHPVNPHAAAVHSMRAYPLVSAVPEPVDLAGLEEAVQRVSRLVGDHDNPLVAFPDGVAALDARIRISLKGPAGRGARTSTSPGTTGGCRW